MVRAAEFLPGLDQPLMDRIELVGALRNDVALDRLFEPGPLKHRRLEDRGRRIRVVLKQLCRVFAVKGKIEPAIEAGLVLAPALRDQRPERLRYFQAAQVFFVSDRAADEFEAHAVDLGGRRLDLVLDLAQRERVIGALVPIALAVDGVEIEARGFGGRAPVVAFGTDDALHGKALAAAVVMAVAMPMDAVRGDAEAAIGRAAIGSAIRAWHSHQSGAAVVPARHQPHRYRAGSGTSHQGQDDASRTFHGAALGWRRSG